MKEVMDRKGILMPETLKIIIAVFSLGILIYLGAQVFGIFQERNEHEQAEANLENIKGIIEALENESRTYILNNPKGWILISFPSVDSEQLCMCPNEEENKGGGQESYSSCRNEGVCQEYKNEVSITSQDKIIDLEKIPREITIKKEGDKASIS